MSKQKKSKGKAKRQGNPEVMVRIPKGLLAAFKPWAKRQRAETLQVGIRAAMAKACGWKGGE